MTPNHAGLKFQSFQCTAKAARPSAEAIAPPPAVTNNSIVRVRVRVRIRVGVRIRIVARIRELGLELHS